MKLLPCWWPQDMNATAGGQYLSKEKGLLLPILWKRHSMEKFRKLWKPIISNNKDNISLPWALCHRQKTKMRREKTISTNRKSLSRKLTKELFYIIIDLLVTEVIPDKVLRCTYFTATYKQSINGDTEYT